MMRVSLTTVPIPLKPQQRPSECVYQDNNQGEASDRHPAEISRDTATQPPIHVPAL